MGVVDDIETHFEKQSRIALQNGEFLIQLKTALEWINGYGCILEARQDREGIKFILCVKASGFVECGISYNFSEALTKVLEAVKAREAKDEGRIINRVYRYKTRRRLGGEIDVF